MSEFKPLDGSADVLPVGLQPTPFGEVWQALQSVAADVWDVDPSVYRAGMAWLWYAVNHPDDLASDSLRALLVAALISEQAPMVKDWQTNAELVEYLRIWRTYSPIYAKLEAIFATFGAQVEVRPISDAESQGVVPVDDRRLAFYLRVENFDPARSLTLDEVYQIAVRATPLGSRPVPYYALVSRTDTRVGPASAGVVRTLWAREPAVPVTPPTPAYTEITLYIQSGSKNIQTQITSGFTGNVNSSYVYPLYEDENLTIPWDGYDYSNNYQVGYIGSLDGEWHRRLDNISDLPDTTVSTGVELAFVLLDTGAIWLCSNSAYSSASSPVSGVIVLRIYPKGQQYFAAYMNYNSAYSNYTLVNTYSREGVSSPGGSSNRYIQTPHQFPKITLQKVLGSAGNELTRSQFTTYQGADSTRFRLYNYGPSTADVRVAVYTLEYPIVGHWLKSDGTNISTSSGVAYPLMNIGGEIVEIDNNYDYFPIGLIRYDGLYATDTYSYLNKATMGSFDTNNPTRLCFKQVSGTLSLSYVQYYRKPKPPVNMAYCTDQGINGENKGGISNASWYELYDAEGNAISVDPSKQYVCTKAFLKDGTSVDNWENGSYVDPSVCYVRLSSSSGTLKFNADPLPWNNAGYMCYSMSYREN